MNSLSPKINQLRPVADKDHFTTLGSAIERQQAVEDAISRTRQRLNIITADAVTRANSQIDALIATARH